MEKHRTEKVYAHDDHLRYLYYKQRLASQEKRRALGQVIGCRQCNRRVFAEGDAKFIYCPTCAVFTSTDGRIANVDF